MSKEFVHVFAIVVKDNKVVDSFDLRRRDVDQATAFAYFANKRQNYSRVVLSEDSLDATFYRSEDNSDFTRLVVIEQSEVASTCERCAAKRGQAHAAYCDSAQVTVKDEAKIEDKKTAFSLMSSLKLKASASAAIKASEASATSEASDTSEAAKSKTAKK